jgi:hypothetical protein
VESYHIEIIRKYDQEVQKCWEEIVPMEARNIRINPIINQTEPLTFGIRGFNKAKALLR